MVINFLKYGLLITAIHMLLGSSCKKSNTSKPCRNATYSFAVTSDFSPQQEAYNVGDTIYLTSSFPKTMTNLIGNVLIDYSNSLGIGGNFAIGLLDSSSATIQEALNKFKIINVTGTSSPISNSQNGGLNINYKEDGNYSFKIGLVCLTKGIYRFGLTDLGSQGLKGKNCTNAAFNMTVTNSNKHINLFQLAIGYTPDALAIKNIYCFRVQ